MREYRITTLTISGQRNTYTLELEIDNLYEATLRARDIFESYPHTKIVVDVECTSGDVRGSK